MPTAFKTAMDKAAYEALLKTNPEVIQSLKQTLKSGVKARELEKQFRRKYGTQNLTAMSTICAAYHIESNPDLLKA